MDNLTHSLVGAVLGQAGLKRTTGLAMPALIIGANLPDVDAACFFWLEGTEHLAFRRGITHGPPALVLLPLILAVLLWGFDRWQTKRGTRPEGRLPVRFGWLYAMAFVGCLSHPFFDWLNVYGIRLLEPFSSQWFYGDTLFIIDPWLWALLIGAVWWSRRREKVGAEWARAGQIGVAAAAAYIVANGMISSRAVEDVDRLHGSKSVGPYDIIASPAPLAFWEREMIRIEYDPAGGFLIHLSRWPSAVSRERQIPERPCRSDAIEVNAQWNAFLFWTRAPVLEASQDGNLVVYDARFYDPRARDRFSVAMPHVRCEELPEG